MLKLTLFTLAMFVIANCFCQKEYYSIGAPIHDIAFNPVYDSMGNITAYFKKSDSKRGQTRGAKVYYFNFNLATIGYSSDKVTSVPC